jgi:RNA polymerase sigma-70 factor (ECF subfamily)
MPQDSTLSGPGVSIAVNADSSGDVHSSFALLLRARSGDEDACNELCARYLPRLRRWAHGRLPGWARQHLDTEDIVQDTLMQSVRRLPDVTPEHERAFCAYVSQALRNRLRDAVRRALTRPSGQPPRRKNQRRSARLEQASACRCRTATPRQSARGPDRELVIARVELV